MNLDLTKEQILDIKKFMAFVLRHKPYFYHIKLDADGFAMQHVLVKAIEKNKKILINEEQLVEICKRHSGGIFIVKDNKIKAKDGHTVTLNMNIPDGYIETKDVPNILYCLLDQSDISKIMVNSGISFGDTKLFLTRVQTLADGKRVVTINAHKAKSDLVKFYHNPSMDTYYTKHISSKYLSVHV